MARRARRRRSHVDGGRRRGAPRGGTHLAPRQPAARRWSSRRHCRGHSRPRSCWSSGLGLPEPPIVDERLRPGADGPIWPRRWPRAPDARRVMFVATSRTCRVPSACSPAAAAVRLRKGAIACVEFPGRPGAGSRRAGLAARSRPLRDRCASRSRPPPAAGGLRALPGRTTAILLSRNAQGGRRAANGRCPAAGVDFGEAPRDAVIRELGEETGLTGRDRRASPRWTRGRDLHRIRRRPADGASRPCQIVYRVRIIGGVLRDEPDGSSG